MRDFPPDNHGHVRPAEVGGPRGRCWSATWDGRTSSCLSSSLSALQRPNTVQTTSREPKHIQVDVDVSVALHPAELSSAAVQADMGE
jgi:hypothetical protein